MPGAPLSFGYLLSSPSAPKQSLYLRHTEDLNVWVVCWITEFITRFTLLLHITHCYFLPKKNLLEFFSRQYSTSEHTSTSVLICDASQTKKFQRIIPKHWIPFCKSPCGSLQSDSVSPASPCSTPWWEITFCLDSRLFSSRCAKVTDFSSWWQQHSTGSWGLQLFVLFTAQTWVCLWDLKEKCASEYLRLCCTICCLISTLWYTSFPGRFLNAVLLLDILWWLHCS